MFFCGELWHSRRCCQCETCFELQATNLAPVFSFTTIQKSEQLCFAGQEGEIRQTPRSVMKETFKVRSYQTDICLQLRVSTFQSSTTACRQAFSLDSGFWPIAQLTRSSPDVWPINYRLLYDQHVWLAGTVGQSSATLALASRCELTTS